MPNHPVLSTQVQDLPLDLAQQSPALLRCLFAPNTAACVSEPRRNGNLSAHRLLSIDCHPTTIILSHSSSQPSAAWRLRKILFSGPLREITDLSVGRLCYLSVSSVGPEDSKFGARHPCLREWRTPPSREDLQGWLADYLRPESRFSRHCTSGRSNQQCARCGGPE